MTLAELRAKLIEAMCRAVCDHQGKDADSFDIMLICGPNNEPVPVWKYFESDMEAAFAAISAAGFSIVADGAFEAFDLALVDLARKTKRVGHGEKSASYMPPAYRRSDPDDTYEAGRMEARGDLARKPE